MNSGNEERWKQAGAAYRDLTDDPRYDTQYLRRRGLIPTVTELIGPSAGLVVLDAGSGPGWLLDEISRAEVYPCDIDSNAAANRHRHFSVQDVRYLGYEDGVFDVVVANFVLMWIPKIDEACREFHRVAKPGGRLVMSLVHPYFYRTGTARDDGTYLVTRELSRRGPIADLKIAGQVGPLDYHYHRTDDYLNALIRAGWKITQVRDWYIDIDDYRKNNQTAHTAIPRTDHVPHYLFLECSKPKRDSS